MKNRRKIVQALPWLAFAAAILLSVGFYALYGRHNLDSDISSELIFAQLLNEEGNFTTFTDSWLYSTELRVVSPVPLYQLGLRLFSSWSAAHTFAVTLMVLIIALSALFMGREMGLGDAAVWLAAMFAQPFSAVYAYIVFYGGSYWLHTVFAFLLVGLVCRYGRLGARAVCAALIAAISFVGGLGGVRLPMMIVCPLAAASALLALAHLKNCAALREGAHSVPVRMAAASGMSLAFCGAGYLVNTRVLGRIYAFPTYENQIIGHLDLADYLKQIWGMIVDLGLREGIPLLSQEGVACMLTLAYFGLMIFSALWLIFHWREITPYARLFALTGIIAVALGMTLVILFNQLRSRYYLVGTLMLTSLPVIAWAAATCRGRAVRTGVFAAITLAFFFQTSVYMRYDCYQGEVNYEMAADWLVDQGFTQGFATYWNASVLTEASDGALEVWALSDRDDRWAQLKLLGWLQKREHLTSMPDGRVFLLVDEREAQLDTPLLDPGRRVAEQLAWSYDVYAYDSVEEMRALIAQEK